MSMRYRFGVGAVVAVVLAAGGALAGDLTPPGPPGPTMYSLEDIYLAVTGDSNVVNTTSGDAVAGDLLAGKKAWVDGGEVVGTRPVAPIAKTGQTNSYTTADDGDLEKGVAWPSPRFTDNSDGTVTDNLTGLIWLKNANAFGLRAGTMAPSDCATLNSGEAGLTDGSVEGDWRLPNVRELQSLIDYGRYNPALPLGHLFTDVQAGDYGSSSTYADDTDDAWYVRLVNGHVSFGNKTLTSYVWPVRGGQ